MTTNPDNCEDSFDAGLVPCEEIISASGNNYTVPVVTTFNNVN